MTENNNKTEYRILMLELHKKNQTFLNNLISIVSVLAVPFLYNVLSAELAKTNQCLLSIAFSGFCFVILLQIISIKFAIKGCDNSLSNNKDINKKGRKLFEIATRLNQCRDLCFLVSIVLASIAIVLI